VPDLRRPSRRSLPICSKPDLVSPEARGEATYVKFIAFAQRKMDLVEEGVVGVITNHSWLDNPTFRGMRQSLMESFEQIYLIDLHGSAKKGKKRRMVRRTRMFLTSNKVLQFLFS